MVTIPPIIQYPFVPHFYHVHHSMHKEEYTKFTITTNSHNITMYNLTRDIHNIYIKTSRVPSYHNPSTLMKLGVMFITAVARSRYNEEGVCTFDGKLRIFPFTYQIRSKNKVCKHRGGDYGDKGG